MTDDLISRAAALRECYGYGADTAERIRSLPAVAASQTADPVVKADSQQSVRVKPLVWSPYFNGFSLHTDTRLAAYSDARTVVGTYSVGRQHSYIKSSKPDERPFDHYLSSSWWLETPNLKILGPFNGDMEAKAAAQADHEQRILTAIEPQPISKSKECPQTSVLRDDLHDPRDAVIAGLHNCISILDCLIAESKRSIGYDEEDPFRMGEWFEDEELTQIEKARSALYAAKAAAQADYEQRILSAIETKPDPHDAVIAQLVEALNAVKTAVNDEEEDWDIPARVYAKLERALAAAKQLNSEVLN